MRDFAIHLGYGEYEDLYKDFMHIISAMDAEYVGVFHEELKRKQAESERNSKSKYRSN